MAVGPTTQAQHVVREDDSLSNEERWRLTYYKWRYKLESEGFAANEVPGLIFLKWLRLTKRLAS